MEREYEQLMLASLRDRVSKSKPFPLKSELERLIQLLEEEATCSVRVQALSQRRENVASLNCLLDELHMVLGNKSPCSFSALVFTSRLRRSLTKIKQQVQGRKSVRLSGRSREEAGDDNEYSNLVKKYQGFEETTSPLVDADKIHGFDGKADFLESLILQGGANESPNKFKAIGLFGVHGVGKTTLCQMIFNKCEVKNHFVPRVWICMSNQPNEDEDTRKEIVRRILTSLGVEDETVDSTYLRYGLQGLLLALHLKLVGKRYLIVLDGAWSIDCFFENLISKNSTQDKTLAHGLPKGYGGTVIVTSTSEEVAKLMVGEEDLYHVQPLSDLESCWRIFTDSVEEDIGRLQLSHLKGGMKKEIIQESGGIPSFIKMMGQLMREKLEHTYENEHKDEIHRQL